MTPEEFAKIAELFETVRSRPLGERESLLERLCADSPHLHAEVASLLAHHGTNADAAPGAPAKLDSGVAVNPAGHDLTDDVRRSPATAALPSKVGPYRILSKIGEGGMGIVYRAQQENPNRTVALKVIRPGAVPRSLLKRFALEANVLGRLQHVGIAQIFEAGTAVSSDHGAGTQPFLAMEYIDGSPITDYVVANRLTPHQCLDLFARVCDAAQHAHDHGIIHRDLKPGNVLVDRSGQPKVLDFGVARATDSDIQATTLHTDIGQLIGTIPYMSPEQVTGDALALDTRSDIYSLGVLLYRLLAGRLPYDLVKQTIPQALRTIQTVEPERLSTFNTIFRGDIETIVGKALEKSPEARYQSAGALGDDIRRYLRHEPIVARSASTIYQLRKFARRHKGLVTSVTIVFAVLVVGVVVSSSQWVRAVRAERLAQDRLREALSATALAEQRRIEAEHQGDVARAVNDFLNDGLLAGVDPSITPDREITMREVLETAAAKVDGAFDGQPLVEASVRTTIGRTMQSLGLYDASEPHLQRAVALSRAARGDEDGGTLRAMALLAYGYERQGKYDEAEALFLTTLPLQQHVLGKDHAETLATANNLGALYLSQGRYDEAERFYVENLEASLRVLGEKNVDTIQAMHNLGAAYAAQGDFARSTSLLDRALQTQRSVFGEEHPGTLAALHNILNLLFHQGRYDEAEAVLVEMLPMKRRVLGPDHPDTLRAVNDLATVYTNQDQRDKALPLQREALEIQRRTLGEDHPDTLRSMNTLAGIYLLNENYAEAEPLYVTSLAARRRLLGDDHIETAVSLATLGALYNKQQRYAEAEPLIEEALRAARRMLPPSHYYIGAFLRYHGHCLSGQHRYRSAETALQESYRILSKSFGNAHAQTQGSVRLLRSLYESWHEAEPELGHDKDAAEWQAKLVPESPENS